ncbi:MAG TPA: sulfite oxidase [Kofleriaceae bacterium]|nr:sulfite oxidase [Kofleriaceae bacterium]
MRASATLALAGCAVRRAGQSTAPMRDVDPEKAARQHLITRLDDPYCGEAQPERLIRDWLTPESDFFIVNHGNVPVVDAPDSYTIEIFGHIQRGRPLRLADLRSMPHTTVEATLQCAGNRRSEYDAIRRIDDPVIWDRGAIGNARWTGVRLVDVLEQVGVKNDASHVWLEGQDVGADGRFGGSIPIPRIYDRDAPPVLLAFEMNGKPLSPSHGFPVRAVVPGFIGARSVKWLSRILVATRPSHNSYFLRNHHWLDGPDGVDQGPIYGLKTNAVICTPASGAAGAGAGAGAGLRGAVTVAGYAIAGDPRAVVDKVEVSADGGRTWQAATLERHAVASCWRRWRADVEVKGPTKIVARATDSAGVVQPEVARWNRGGYLYDGWSVVEIA